MSSEGIESVTLRETKISSTDEDKKFVSQAVAFVIGHTRNGSMVPLCASIATMLKEQTRLKIENESLKQQVSDLQSKLLAQTPKDDISRTTLSSINLESFKKKSNALHQYTFNRKKYKYKSFKALKECLCDTCVNDVDDLPLSPPLKKGDKVVISGEIIGTVCYIGHVDKLSFPEIYIGLHLDEAVGDCNGSIGMKSYFIAPPGHGLFAPLLNVCCLIN